jgi:hypothetical protein
VCGVVAAFLYLNILAMNEYFQTTHYNQRKVLEDESFSSIMATHHPLVVSSPNHDAANVETSQPNLHPNVNVLAFSPFSLEKLL